jgi:hypothetical protein
MTLLERLAAHRAHRALHDLDALHRGGKAATLIAVARECRVDRVRRDCLAEFRTGGAVLCRAPSSVPVTVQRSITTRMSGCRQPSSRYVEGRRCRPYGAVPPSEIR